MELQVKPTNLIANIEQAKNYLIEVIKKSAYQECASVTTKRIRSSGPSQKMPKCRPAVTLLFGQMKTRQTTPDYIRISNSQRMGRQ